MSLILPRLMYITKCLDRVLRCMIRILGSIHSYLCIQIGDQLRDNLQIIVFLLFRSVLT
jgi:hypothetical protein